MKQSLKLVILSLIAVVFSSVGFAQGTAFTYQGRLNNNAAPASGIYDLQFTVYDTASVGIAQGGPLTNSATAVSGGLFTVTLDFGAGVFTGADRWLEIGVRTNGGGAFTVLSPRQLLTATPYALRAGNVTGSVAAGQISGALGLAQLPSTVLTNGASGVNISGTFTGNGAGVSNVNFVAADLKGAITWTTNHAWVFSSTLTPGSGPHTIVSADINGDGKPDLISANINVTTLSIFTNNGSGGFALSSSPNLVSRPYNAQAVDMNGDGKLDLICAHGFSNVVSVLTNDGNGNFTLAATPTVGLSPFWVTAADVNNDGKMDLISANNSPNTLSVLTNNGAGGWVLSSSPGVGLSPLGVTAADVNGDGKVDLISANGSAFSMTVLTNNGSGGFVVSSSPSTGQGPRSVVAADVSGDGKPDLICANFNDGTLTVSYNLGNGTFTPLGQYPVVGGNASGIAVADLNGDGKLDVASANFNSPMTMLQNNGSGIMLPFSSAAVGAGAAAVEAVDVNGDGLIDLVSANQTAGTLTVLLHTLSYSANFTGNGAGLTALNATNVTGTLGASQIPNLDMSKITTGSLIDARLSANIPRLDGSQSFTGQNSFINSSNSFAGNGSGLYNLNASAFSSGTILDAVIPSGIARLFTAGNQTFTGQNTFNNAANSFTGNGGGLTNLNVANLVGGLPAANLTGTVADARLSANVPLLNGTNVFTGTNRFAGVMVATNGNNQFTGNGGGLTNLNAANLVGGLSAGSLTGTIADARLSANVALLNANQTFTGANAFNNAVNISSNNALRLGVGLPNQEPNAGRIGYELFTPGALDIVGAGTNGSFRGIKLWAEVGLSVTGPVTATAFNGNGSGLNNLNAANLTGVVPSASLTSIPAGNLTGTIADARHSANVPLLSANQTFTGTNLFGTNVGIGTTNPMGMLEIQGGADSSGGADGKAIALAWHGGGYRHWIRTRHNASADNGNGIDFFVNTNTTAAGSSAPGTGNVFVVTMTGAGNMGVGTTNPTNRLHVAGGVSATAFVNTSDRNAKENFAPVSPQDVLNKVVTLPITTWNFKSMNDGRHMGPMAQDFYSAFGLGGGETTITSVDPDGVALAAIQGLNQKLDKELEQSRAELKRRDAENAELKARLEKLEALLKVSGGAR